MIRKLFRVFQIYVQDCFAYPAASFIWVLADVQAAILLPVVWIAASGATGVVAGMNHSQLISYYLCVTTLSQFVTCHLLWDIAFDIRDGFFSPMLVRPMSFFWFCVARNFAWRTTKLVLFAPIFGFMLLAYGTGGGTAFKFDVTFVVVLILAHSLSFLSAYCVALITLWTTEFFSIFRLYYLPEMFLSGRLIPLATLPVWAKSIGNWTHFQYTVSFPAQVLTGKLSDSAVIHGVGMQIGWCALFGVLGTLMFRLGVRQYSGVGM